MQIFRLLEHVLQIENVSVKVNAIDSVGHAIGQIGQVRVTDIVFDRDVFDWKAINLAIDALLSSVFVPRTHLACLSAGFELGTLSIPYMPEEKASSHTPTAERVFAFFSSYEPSRDEQL